MDDVASLTCITIGQGRADLLVRDACIVQVYDPSVTCRTRIFDGIRLAEVPDYRIETDDGKAFALFRIVCLGNVSRPQVV